MDEQNEKDFQMLLRVGKEFTRFREENQKNDAAVTLEIKGAIERIEKLLVEKKI